MIHFFNRTELMRTSDAEELARIRSALEHHNIPYTMKIRAVRGNDVGWNNRAGVLPGANPTLGTLYRIYIRRDDLQRASYLISK